MSWLTLLMMALGLAADAFVAALACGLAARGAGHRSPIPAAACFAAAQGLMPLIGWLTMGAFSDNLQRFNWLIVGGLLTGLGAYRLWQARTSESCAEGCCSGGGLLLTAMATGIDALSAGVTMALSPQTGCLAPPWGGLISCAAMALVAFVLCLIGGVIGHRAGRRFGRPAMVAGGAVLMVLGMKALVGHFW